MNRNEFNHGKQQKLWKYFFFLVGICFFISIIIFYKMDNSHVLEETKNIEDLLKNTHINFLVFHFVILAVLLLSSITIIGFLLFPFYLLFELICIFYNLIIFTRIFYLKGFIFSLFYILITKGVYIILLLIIFKKLINIVKSVILYKSASTKIDLKVTLLQNLKPLIFSAFFIFLNDILLYFVGNKILFKLFDFMF